MDEFGAGPQGVQGGYSPHTRRSLGAGQWFSLWFCIQGEEFPQKTGASNRLGCPSQTSELVSADFQEREILVVGQLGQQLGRDEAMVRTPFPPLKRVGDPVDFGGNGQQR